MSTYTITLEQLQARLRHLRVEHVAIVGQYVTQAVVTGAETPRFNPSYYDPCDPLKVGYLDGYTVIADPGIPLQPRMQVSTKFAKIQSPDLVRKTNEWMHQFFGEHRPIYQHGNRLMMHPDTLREYTAKYGQQ